MAKRTTEVRGVHRRYSWRLYPTPEQDRVLREQAGMVADLWNALLELSEVVREARVWVFDKNVGGPLLFDLGGNLHAVTLADVLWRRRALRYRPSMYEVVRDRRGPRHTDQVGSPETDVIMPFGKRADGRWEVRTSRPSEFDMGYWITAMLKECPEWRMLSTWTPRRVAGMLDAAWRSFFSRAKSGAGAQSGYPRYKAHRLHLSIPHRCASGAKWVKSDRHERSWHVHLKGVGTVWARGALPSRANGWNDVDVMFRDGKWEASVAVELDRRRHPGHRPAVVRFDLIDCLAKVNDVPETPAGVIAARDLMDRKDQMLSELDRRWPPTGRHSDEEWRKRCEMRARIGMLESRIKRVRRDALHVWTTRLVKSASDLVVHAPPIKTNTQTPRGDKREWGAAVEAVSEINRNVLSYAPAAAVAMIIYKAEEAGVPCRVVEDENPNIAIGAAIVDTDKTLRRARKEIRDDGRKRQRQTPPPKGGGRPSPGAVRAAGDGRGDDAA